MRCRIWSSAWAEPIASRKTYLTGDLIDAALIEKESLDRAIGLQVHGVFLRWQEVYQQSVVDTRAFCQFYMLDFLQDDHAVGIGLDADPVDAQAPVVRSFEVELLFHIAAQRRFAVRLAEIELAAVEIRQQRGQIVRGVGVHDLGAAGALVVADVGYAHVKIMGMRRGAGQGQHGCREKAQAVRHHSDAASLLPLALSGVLKSRIRLFLSRSVLNNSTRDLVTLRGQALLLVSMSAVSQYGSCTSPTIGSSVTISLVIFFDE